MSIEKTKSERIIAGKAFEFALEIVKLYKLLANDKKNMFYQNKYFVQELRSVLLSMKQLLDNRKGILFIIGILH